MIAVIELTFEMFARIVAWWRKIDVNTLLHSWLLESESPKATQRWFKVGEEIGVERFNKIMEETALSPFFSPWKTIYEGKFVIAYRGAIITGECPHCGFQKNYHYGCPRCYSLR